MQANFNSFCKRNSIIFPLLDPQYVRNTVLRKFLLPVETVSHNTRLESENSKPAFPFSPTAYNYTVQPVCAHSYTNTTKQYNRYVLTVTPIQLNSTTGMCSQLHQYN